MKKLEIITSVDMPVDEKLEIKKTRFTSDGRDCGKRISIVTGIHGDELEGQYVCWQVARRIQEHPELLTGTVDLYPAMNPLGIDSITRGIPAFDLDMNRLFPGSRDGAMTEYMPGDFTPHVRIMDTGRDYLEKAKEFGLPYIVKRKPRPYDTATLNYNWQIWDTDSFSLYSNTTERIDEESAQQMVQSVMNFMIAEGMITGQKYQSYQSQLISDGELIPVRPYSAGLFQSRIKVGQRVERDQQLAEIIDPYDGAVMEKLNSPVTGTVFFVHNHPMTYANTAVLKIVPGE